MKERIFIFNKYDELLAITNHYVEAIFEETVEKPVSFSITFPMSDKDAAYFVGGNQVAFKDLKGNLRLFTIREVDDIDGEAPEKVIQCMPAMQELTDVIVTDGETVNESAEAVLGIILQYSRWKVGHVADLGLYDISFSYQNAYDCLGKLTSRWGGEIVDRIEVAGNKITGRYIDIVQRKGSDTGKRFEMDKDIKNLTRTVLYYPKTALYGQGKSLQSGEEGAGKVTFRDVEWVKEKGDPTDKPKGQAWVGDSVALETHGVFNHETGELMHRFGLFEDNDEEDPEKLLVKTWEAVQTEKAPKVQYEMDIITFYGIADYEHEHVFLGDTGIARDKDMKPMVLVEARIMSWKYDIGNPRDGSLVLGNILDLNPDERDMDWVIDKVKEDSASWDAGGGPITDGRFPDIVPDTPQDVSATGLFKKIMLSWTFESTYAIAAYEIYASQINGFFPDSTNLVFRGKVGAYNFDADTDEKWYFRVRAVNTHGTASEYSEQVSASTVQLHLSDLEKIVPDFIEYGIYKGEASPSPSEYKYWLNTSENPNILYHWDEESESWKPLAPKNAADVGAISIADYQEQVGQLVTDLANKVDAEWVNGRLVAKANKADVYTVEQLDNKFDNVVSKTVYESDQQGIITDLQNQESRISQTETDIQSKVSNQQYTQDKESLRTSINENQSSIEQNAELIASKVSNEEYRTDKEGIINDIKANKSSIEQNAESIRSKVDATYVEDEIGKIEVGGRNLIQDSEERTMEAASDNNFMHVTLYNRLEKDTIYTLSFQAEFLEGSSDVISIYPYKKSGQSMAVIDMPYQINRMSATFQTDNRFHYNLLVYAGENGNTAGNKLKLTRIKLEKGNKATDWTPAPEDTQAEIQSIEQYASEIEQTAKGIKQNVNSLETDYSTFKKEANSTFDQQATQIALRVTETIYNTDMEDMTMRVSEAESSIEQNADEIVSKVSKNGVLSSINQSPEQIKINAQRVSIDGDLVVRNGKVYVKDGIITDNLISGNAKIDGAKIADASITNAKIGNMNADKIRAGVLRSKNNNSYWDLNNGQFYMKDANFTLGGGADIELIDKGNKLFYERKDPESKWRRFSGIGVGNNINDRFPFVYMGTSAGSSLTARDKDYFTGFIANTNARMNIDNIGNSVVGKLFHVRDKSVDFNKGFLFDLSSNTCVMRPMNTGSYKYHLGSINNQFDRAYIQDIRTGTGYLRIRNSSPDYTGQGFTFETTYSGDRQLTFRGTHSSDYHNLGKPGWRFSYIYLRYQPDVSSDIRVKENILNNNLGLEFIDDVETKSFKLKSSFNEPVQYGVVAQQLKTALIKHGVNIENINMLSLGKDNMYGVQYNQLIAPIIKSIQELYVKLKKITIEKQKLEECILEMKKSFKKRESINERS
ncbi:hypothetical protein CAI16_13070 [Virgibacillus dokdonensis]|uniref:Peptidase S74 domain-containing protein n=1 Tax=Virgibacillus dokdonensis TaxID=302167 RepID=A0A3E0WNI1_9BACI|nr:phage tail spike protein [Virgibacillus dokdonensis]RFA33959.1 hypothetical protein CAI16_13070 [Virgibacillus dokdonensis]